MWLIVHADKTFPSIVFPEFTNRLDDIVYKRCCVSIFPCCWPFGVGLRVIYYNKPFGITCMTMLYWLLYRQEVDISADMSKSTWACVLCLHHTGVLACVSCGNATPWWCWHSNWRGLVSCQALVLSQCWCWWLMLLLYRCHALCGCITSHSPGSNYYDCLSGLLTIRWLADCVNSCCNDLWVKIVEARAYGIDDYSCAKV